MDGTTDDLFFLFLPEREPSLFFVLLKIEQKRLEMEHVLPCTKMTSGTDVGYICAGWFKQKGDVSHTSSGYRIARIWMENALAAAAHDTCCGDNSSPGLSFLISPYKHLFYFFAFLFPFSFFFLFILGTYIYEQAFT